MIWVIPLVCADFLYKSKYVHFLRLFRKQIPHEDISIQSGRYHFGVILVDINWGDCGFMKIKRAYKLPFINFINWDSPIFIPNINSCLGRLDYSNVDISLVFVKIFDWLTCFLCDNSDVLVDTCHNYFFFVIEIRTWWNDCEVALFGNRLTNRLRKLIGIIDLHHF